MIQENLDSMIKEAMISKDTVATRTYRLIKTEFINFKTAKVAKPLDTAAEISILKRMVKEREESAEIYQQNNRQDLADKELEEAKCIKNLLPAEVSREEIEKIADTIVVEKNMRLMGQYVGALKKMYPTADGKVIAEVVKSKLS